MKRTGTKYPSTYIQSSEYIEALSYNRTDRPWRILVYEDDDFVEEVDGLTSTDRKGLYRFIIDNLNEGYYVLINYGRNWCEYVTPQRYKQCLKKYGPIYALGHATHVYDGDTYMFEEIDGGTAIDASLEQQQNAARSWVIQDLYYMYKKRPEMTLKAIHKIIKKKYNPAIADMVCEMLEVVDRRK